MMGSPYKLLQPGSLIYVAGPYTARTAWGRRRNVLRAVRAGMRVIRVGAVPVIPHSLYHQMFGAIDEPIIVKAGLELLARCSKVLVLPGWERSRGTLGEIREASRRHLDTIFLSEADL